MFVHGLNPLGARDHHRKTWMHKEGFFWPEDTIINVAFSRVMIFGWNSAVLDDPSNAPLYEHANDLLDELHNKRSMELRHRPLVFIAHSMGGLLVKQSLIAARLDPTHECMLQSTYGLMFFATPHRGGNWAGIADFAANIVSGIRGEAKNALLNDIALDQFSHQRSNYDIISYFEIRPTRVKVKGRRVLSKIASTVCYRPLITRQQALQALRPVISSRDVEQTDY